MATYDVKTTLELGDKILREGATVSDSALSRAGQSDADVKALVKQGVLEAQKG